MMSKPILLTVCFTIVEIILAFAFAVIAQIYYNKVKGFEFKAILKGTFERLFISIALVNDLPHALTLFSALKLATRLRHAEPEGDHNKYNDYYLIGNLASVIVAIAYSYAFCHFSEIALFRKLCQ